jgi:hypothetical protein
MTRLVDPIQLTLRQGISVGYSHFAPTIYENNISTVLSLKIKRKKLLENAVSFLPMFDKAP